MFDIDIWSCTTYQEPKRRLVIRLLKRKLPMLIEVTPTYNVIPPFYGVVWVYEEFNATLCALIPFNIPLATLYWLWAWLRTGWARFLWKHSPKSSKVK